MPKLKTHKGAAKRFKKTGTGKIKRHKTGLRHTFYSLCSGELGETFLLKLGPKLLAA